MFFYSYFCGHGRANLMEALDDADPFALAPTEILERVIAAGYAPAVQYQRREPWPTIGPVGEIKRKNLTFFVAVSRNAQEITVQEVRADAYDPVEITVAAG